MLEAKLIAAASRASNSARRVARVLSFQSALLFGNTIIIVLRRAVKIPRWQAVILRAGARR